MSEKITIIEGPTPLFREANGLWAQSLIESHLQHETIFTELRAFDGKTLVKRCLKTWKKQDTIHLEFRNEQGLTDSLPIVAVHNEETEEGDRLQLWLQEEREEVEIELEFDEFDDDDLEDLF